MKTSSIPWSFLLVVVLLSGCGSSKLAIPAQEMAAARQAVEQAEQVGAEEYAPLEIRQARQKIDRARKYLDDKEPEKAKMMIEQAKVDAELAQAKSLSSKSQKAVDELQETIRTLREEIERNKNN